MKKQMLAVCLLAGLYAVPVRAKEMTCTITMLKLMSYRMDCPDGSTVTMTRAYSSAPWQASNGKCWPRKDGKSCLQPLIDGFMKSSTADLWSLPPWTGGSSRPSYSDLENRIQELEVRIQGLEDKE